MYDWEFQIHWVTRFCLKNEEMCCECTSAAFGFPPCSLNKIIILTTNSVEIHRVQAGNKLVLCKLFSQIIQSLLYIFNHTKLVLEGLLGTVRPGCTPSGLTVGLCPWQQQRRNEYFLCLWHRWSGSRWPSACQDSDPDTASKWSLLQLWHLA